MKKLSEEHKEKIRQSRIGVSWGKHTEETKRRISESEKGKTVSSETRKKISVAVLGRKISEETKIKMSKARKGEKGYQWIKDRTQLVQSEKKHLDGRYKEWMKSVKDRDNWKCKIADKNCKGKLEAHHILRWSEFPELRYEVNNGITLCHFHHPRKRNDEMKLSPYFQELVKAQ